MSKVDIPKEQKTAYERWEMSSFEEGGHSSGISRPKKPSAAEEEIKQLFERVRKEAYTKGMQEGFEIGMQEGFDAGMAKAKVQAQEDKQNFLKLMAAFSEALEKSDEQVADDVLSLALDIAKSMLKVKLNVDSSVILPVVMDAIHYLPSIQLPAKILVHRDDVQLLRESMEDEISSNHWEIQEGNNIERGGCLVETGANHIDATNDARWKRIGDALSQSNSWLLP